MTVFVLLSLSAQAHATTCKDLKTQPTKITVALQSPEPFYDLSKSMKDVNKDQNYDAWLTKNGMQQVWKSSEMETLGYASGATGAISDYSFEIKKFDKFGVYYCPYIKHINIEMMFRTKIVIPKDFKKGGCRFNHVHEHEYRHYQANADVAKEFIEKLKRDLPVIVDQMEGMQPYIEGKYVPVFMEDIKASMNDAITIYIKESMPSELSRRNGLIDTPEEYASARPKMAACKD